MLTELRCSACRMMRFSLAAMYLFGFLPTNAIKCVIRTPPPSH